MDNQTLASTSDEQFFDIQFKPFSGGATIVVSGKKVHISHNSGSTWSLLADYADLNKSTLGQQNRLISIRFAKTDPDIFYGAYHANFFKFDLSTNTTTVSNDVNSSKYSRHQALAVSPLDEDEVLIGNVYDIYKSTNGGQTFPPSSMIAQKWHDDLHWIEYRGTANEIWIANDGGVYKTTDGGQNWTNLSDGLGIANYFHLSSSEARPYDIIGAGWDTGPNLHQASTGKFTFTTQFGDAFESLIDDSDPANPVYYTSINSNESMHRFTTIGPEIDITVPSSIGPKGWWDHFVKASNSQDVLFFAGDKRIGRSINQGNNWAPISFNAKAASTGRIFWRVWNHPSNDNFLYAHQVNYETNDPDAFALYRSNNALRPDPDHVTWKEITPELAGYNNGQRIRKTVGMLAVDDENPNKIWIVYAGYVAANPKVLLYDGKMWSDITGTGLEGQSVTTVAHQNSSDDLIYVGTNAGVFYKKDHETQWTLIPGVPHCEVTDMEINHCESKIRVSTNGRGIWEADLIEDTHFDKTEVDLYMKDNPEDVGQSPSPGAFTDHGPDIWYRAQDDGLEVYEPENLVYDPAAPFWVYVRVRNKSCQTSSSGDLKLYWSQAGSAFSWANGEWTDGINGDFIASKPIPAIPAGGSTIIKFEWDMSNYIQNLPSNNLAICLMARIENVTGDPIVGQGHLWGDVKYNNNITMKNVIIRDADFFIQGNRIPMFIGGYEDGGVFDVNFDLPANYTGSPLYEEAEITVKLDPAAWQKWDQANRPGTNVDVMNEDERILLITGGGANIRGLVYEPNERDVIEIAVNFLIDEVTDQNEFPYVVSQSINSSEVNIGAVHFLIRKEPRPVFDADAGSNRSMSYSDSTQLSAVDINEPAVYNWYDSNDSLIYSGKSSMLTAKATQKYKLEVISLVDGFKDYDWVEITVKDLEILDIVPNPATSNVEIQYAAASAKQSASLVLTNTNGSVSNTYTLDLTKKSIMLDISKYASGIYKVILISDGKVVDEGSLAIQ